MARRERRRLRALSVVIEEIVHRAFACRLRVQTTLTLAPFADRPEVESGGFSTNPDYVVSMSSVLAEQLSAVWPTEPPPAGTAS